MDPYVPWGEVALGMQNFTGKVVSMAERCRQVLPMGSEWVSHTGLSPSLGGMLTSHYVMPRWGLSFQRFCDMTGTTKQPYHQRTPLPLRKE